MGVFTRTPKQIANITCDVLNLVTSQLTFDIVNYFKLLWSCCGGVFEDSDIKINRMCAPCPMPTKAKF